MQLILPLLTYNSWIQCAYHLYLRCYVIQDAVFINQEVRRQLLIHAIFKGHWTPIMAANRFLVPNTEEFSEDLIALLQQCGLCCQEYSDGGLTEFLGAWDEEPVSNRYYCSVAIENSVDQKVSSHFLVYKNSVLNYMTSNLTRGARDMDIEFMNYSTRDEVISVARSMIK